MDTVLQTKGLTKKYGKLLAVSNLEFSVQKGQVFGILGPNGSGKTTTLGMLLQVISPTSGSFEWFGEIPSAKSRKNIGAILETPNFYPYLSATDNLKIVAKIKGADKSRINIVLKEVGLYERKSDKFQSYSLGMKQRLAIASSLLSDPEVLILDEPTNGLDPEGIIEIRNLILKIAESGKTILLASHLLSEVQKVCTHFMILKKGNKLHQGSLSELGQDETIIQIAAKDMVLLENTITSLAGVKTVTHTGKFLSISVEPEVTTEFISEALATKGITASHLLKTESSIEEKFINLMQQS
ncbi:ABC transporter ATP-binding protein [Reichenbachiella versicolor]|uniref:ABC transporter ATP-binding protein n=1 Tax=Reichenbachiella versicolor TaxID=1821036 RepID=UPI000D6E9B7A|nr:ATP-binding cassette domain-containing protein [Reichenbachiella versicolor]